ncbi:conserved exported hypothetical protein [Rhodospirillaceae bacterium LM-1]|nr:conserved exported hypothetical protein [Rhodospirillaceae bacterium LM-1]
MFRPIPFLLSLVLAAAAFPAEAAQRYWLVTPDEAASVSLMEESNDSYLMTVGTEVGSGPQIIIKTPKLLDKVHTPVDMLVEFAPGSSGLPPDMSTLTITLRGFVTFDITDRLREYLQKDKLVVEGADLPIGTHRIRMALADTGGNLTARDLTLIISSAP